MKRKFIVIGLCALLVLLAILTFVRRDGGRRAAQATNSELVIAPDGTIAIPRNDHVTFEIVAEVPKPTSNALPASSPSGKR
jgi:hypothetical protein